MSQLDFNNFVSGILDDNYESKKNNNYGIYQGDCLKFLKRTADEAFKLIVTSPPYNIGKSYEKKKPLETYLEFQKQVIEECVRTLQEGGSICWQTGNFVDKGEIVPLDVYLYDIFKSLGLKLRNRIIWHFGHGLHCKKRLSGRYETILWFTKGDDYTFNLDPIRVPQKYPNKKYFKGKNKGKLSCNPLGKNPSDVWEVPNVKNNHPEKTNHPCQFPIELIDRLVLSLTNEGDIVFDPFLGSGTSIIASLKNKRFGLGCEIDKAFVNLSKSRVKEFLKGGMKIREMGTPIYENRNILNS